jgi:hypothetical protein
MIDDRGTLPVPVAHGRGSTIAQFEDVPKAAGHRDPSTRKLYDRRGYNRQKAASFFATY